MNIIRYLPARAQIAPSALTIGNLDGVHLGHQAMLAQVVSAAHELNLSPSVLTFNPHPKQYFAKLHGKPDATPKQINSFRDKANKIAAAGIKQLALLRFDKRLANLSAESFIRDLLVKELKTRWLMVGPDFRFGQQRQGDVALLEQQAKRLGFELVVLPQICDADGHRISSSMVRQALGNGNMARAAELLGSPWRLTGHVMHGKKLGRTLGFPTLNMRVAPHTAVRFGIYVVKVHGLGTVPLPAIASLGIRPTIDDSLGVLLETHIIGSSVDAYGKLVSVELLQHVRDEQKFPNLTTLTDAMQRDRQHAIEYFAHHGL